MVIHAGTVVGSDGFGFAREGALHRKIVHAGTVRVEDDVEIGAGCTIDRSVLSETVIGAGSKLDNLVHVAHNVVIGRNCVLAGQAGLAGSAELEDNVMIGGQAGVSGHLTVGRGSIITGKSALFKSLPEGTHVAGIPAIDAGEWRKISAVLRKLDAMRRKIAMLEKQLDGLKGGTREKEND